MRNDAKVLVTTRAGLVGNAFGSLQAQDNFQKSIFFPEDYGLTVAKLDEVFDLTKDLEITHLVHNASYVPRGLNSNEFQDKALSNLSLFRTLLDYFRNSNINNFAFFSSYQVYRPNNFAPFPMKGPINIFLSEFDSSYIKQKKMEIQLAKEFKIALGANRCIKALICPHLFGPNDKFNFSRAHFVPKVMTIMRYAREFSQSSINISGNLQTRIQLAFAPTMVQRILGEITLDSDKRFIHPVDSGSIVSLNEIVSILSCVMNYQGIIVNSGGESTSNQGHYDLFFGEGDAKPEATKSDLYFNLMLTREWFEREIAIGNL